MTGAYALVGQDGEDVVFAHHQMVDAVQLLARTEAILMDPVYTGKTMAGFLDLIRKGYFEGCKNVLFLHTGGSPALFAYENTILNGVE